MATPAQITASRANGSLSHGPVTSEGKSTSSLNALKLGIFSQSLIIPGEDPADFDQLAAEYHDYYKPVGPVETGILDQAIHAEWMRRRYHRIEAAVINYRAAGHPDPEHAVGAAFDDDHKHGNTLNRLFRRHQAAARDWRENLQLLERRQRARREQEEEALAEQEAEAGTELEYLKAEPVDAQDTTPASPIGAGSFCTPPRFASRRPMDVHENLALRL